MKAHTSERVRSVFLRGDAGDALPDSLARAMDEREVVCGWFRGSGVLREVELRAFDSELGTHGPTRRFAGPVQALLIEGSVGRARGETSVGLRAILARETDRGLETVTGEITAARVVALEAVVTAFDDLALGRGFDDSAGVWLLGDPSAARFRGDEPPAPQASSAPYAAKAAPGRETPRRPEPPAVNPASGAWSDAVAASAEVEAAKPARTGAVMPTRPGKPRNTDDDGALMPEAGDAVEHFAFGRADVLRSDGDRLHLKVHKDGRIREIALEMLKVTPLESTGPHHRFKLDRKL